MFRRVLTDQTSPADWSRWFKDLRIQLTTSEILLVAPSRFVANQVVSRFLGEVTSAARTAGAADRTGIRVTVGSHPDHARVPSPANRKPPAPRSAEARRRPKTRHPSGHHRFGNYQVGPCNLLAHAASSSVSEHPGGYYNPLFIYGDSGLGKTHLLLAIAHRTRRNHPHLTVRYRTSERFVQEFIQSVSTGRMDAFRRSHRRLDMLILDDFQFLQGKEQTLEEFFWTFDTLQQQGKQVVLGCDRSPRDLDAVTDRIRSRVSAGLITELGSPTTETRMAILQAMNDRGPISLADDVLRIVADHITGNIRDLTSALRQLHAYAQLTNLPITPDLVVQQLAPLAGRVSTPQTPENIMATCAEAFGTTVEEIIEHNRRPIPSEARQVAMYLTRLITGLPFARIGAAFHRGHSTVLSAHRRIASQISRDAKFAARVEAINNLVHSP